MTRRRQSVLKALGRRDLRLSRVYRTRGAMHAYRVLRSLARRAGVDLVARTFYSPVPNLDSLPDSTWERRSELAGIRFDLEEQLAFIEQRLAPYLAEFRPPTTSSDPSAFHLANDSYGPVDADVLYAMVRAGKPRRIVELGSGHTSLVISAACQANERDRSPAIYRAFDPFPGVAHAGLAGLTELQALRAEDIPLEVFDELEDGDVLFVDTTHTVKTGSDVNRIVLDILPRLHSGVLVHFHDVFLPWEYPRSWAEDYGLYWAEQYLLQAFLVFNDEFEVVCSLHALVREHPERLSRLLGSWQQHAAAFWIRRR